MSELLQQTAQILYDRRVRRRSLLEWCRFVLSARREEPALHHRLIIDILERVTAGELRRVMILMPPGSAKSTYISVCFPPWYLCRYPQNLILACSYSYNLIEGFGRQCRDLIDLHSKELGYSLSKTASAAGDWRIDRGGGYFCAGVNAGIAGHRADLGFIDDFIGSQEEADSQTIRDKNYAWYRNDFSPRLKPNAARIIIANRRHEDDLIGRLLSIEGDQWTVIKLPMLAEDDDPLGRPPGALLWPEWFTQEMVKEAQLSTRTWAGLYQQRPAPEEGNFFKREWIVEYSPDELPKYLHYYVGSDHAYRLNQENDRSCFLPAGVDNNDRVWILPDWFWTRCDTGVGVEAMLDLAERRKPLCWWAGREAITGSLAPFLHKRMRERGLYIPIEELSEGRDKVTKAQAIRGRMSQKMVMFPRFAPGWDLALHEILTFPNGKHDDFVDALAKLGQGLALMVKANLPGPEPLDIANYKFKPTLGWLKRSHEAQERFQRLKQLDK